RRDESESCQAWFMETSAARDRGLHLFDGLAVTTQVRDADVIAPDDEDVGLLRIRHSTGLPSGLHEWSVLLTLKRRASAKPGGVAERRAGLATSGREHARRATTNRGSRIRRGGRAGGHRL